MSGWEGQVSSNAGSPAQRAFSAHRQRSFVDAKVWIVDVPDRAFFLVAAADERNVPGLSPDTEKSSLPNRARSASCSVPSSKCTAIFGSDGIGVGMVVANGVALLPADLTARAVGTDDALDNTLHQLRYLLAYLLIMSTHRSGGRALSGITL